MRQAYVWFFVTVFHGLRALAAPAGVPPIGGAIESAPGGVVVAGLPSVIERPRSLIPWFADDFSCVDFRLHPIGVEVPTFGLSTVGLRGARLQFIDAPGSACRAPGKGATDLLAASAPADAGRWVRLTLPEAAFPAAAAGNKGKLLLLRDRSPTVEYAVTLLREDFRPFEKGLLWFLGVLVPAALTAALGLAVYRMQKWIDSTAAQADVLERFRRESERALGTFFAALYKRTLELPDDEWVDAMAKELTQQRILLVLPGTALARTQAALRRADRTRLAEVLAEVFPEFKEAIVAPVRTPH